MAKRTCSMEGCLRAHFGRGWCQLHYDRWRTHGDPEITLRGGRPAPTPHTFWAQTAPNGPCVVWTGRVDKNGYGRTGWDGKEALAHRVAFFLRMGRWPDGLLRHLCNNPPCVLHAVEGTQSENMYDRVAAGRHHNALKTHCPQGHPYDDANTIWRTRGGRLCRECRRQAGREYCRRRKAS